MAKLHPDISTFRPIGAGEYAEHAVLQQLSDGLPDTFDVFHSVDWSTADGDKQRFGEIDVVVVDALGHLVLLEVKAGQLEEAGGASGMQLGKRYGRVIKDVIAQSGGQLRGMRQRLHDAGFDGFKVAHLLVLPDHALVAAPVGLPRERIVDASDAPALCRRVLQVIHQGQAEHRGNHVAERSRLLLFLVNQFVVYPDPTARMGMLSKAVVRLSDGLATWVPRIQSDAGLYAVEATAGSGKTQLALRLLQDGCALRLRCLYVCFNRPLADHMIHVAPAAAQVFTFHELAIAHWRRKHGGEPDFSDSSVFEQAGADFAADSLLDVCPESGFPPRSDIDLLVIDEMQDMEPQWVEALASRLKPDGRMYTLGDSQQSVYGRPSFGLAGAVRISCNENVRSPRQIVAVINQMRLTDEKIVARCPEAGEVPDIHVYPSTDAGGVKAVAAALAGLLAKGIDAVSIAIVTFVGKERSRVLALDALGGVALRKFAGRFDAAGNPVWTAGPVQAETLYRFKGQAAPYVIFCEIDFKAMDDRQRRKLFVGMTRAQMHLTLVMSQDAELALAAYIGS